MSTNHVMALIGGIRSRAHELLTAELRRRGHPGLVPSHGAILARLYEQGPLPMSVLAQGIGRRKNTVTTLVRKLEDAGYVLRTPDPTDSRVSLVGLTAKGEAFRAEFQDISTLLLTTVWGDMAPERREQLVVGLEELLRNLA